MTTALRPRIRISLLSVGLVLLAAGCPSPTKIVPQADAALPPTPVDVTGPDGRIDFAYYLDVAEHDHTHETRTYQVNLGELPPGLALDPAGEITGTPTQSGVYEIELWGDSGCGELLCRLVVRLTIEVLPVVLLSGYGPFAGVPDNPSWDGVEPLNEEIVGGYDVRAIELTVTWDDAWAVFLAEYERLKPAIAIGAGVAMGETVIRLESLARNYAQGEDVDGYIKDEMIDPAGDDLDTGLPVTELRDLLEGEGYPVAISNHAGFYLCNYLFYNIMWHLESEPAVARVLGGFVHVPDRTVVSIADMTDAWRLMLEYLTSYRDSQLRVGGQPAAPRDVVSEPPRYLFSRSAPIGSPPVRFSSR